MEPTPVTTHPVMIVLEARVAREHWSSLAEAFGAGGARVPAQMLRAYLVQSAADPELWRILSVWRSRAALDEYRRSAGTPEGVLMFRSAGAEPTFSAFEVASVHTSPTD